MGNKILTFTAENPSFPHPAYWVSQPQASLREDAAYGNFETLRNKLNGKMMDKYEMQFTSSQQQKAYEYYCKIRRASSCVVSAIHYAQIKATSLCSNELKSHLFLENFPVRLCDFQKLSFDDGVYILSRALEGFSQIVGQIGIFGIKQSFICISKHKEVQVWMNSNLSRVQPECPHRDTHLCTQETMLTKLINIVQNKQENQKGKYLFSQFCLHKRKFPRNFIEAKDIFKAYCLEGNITIPSHLTHSLELIISAPITRKGIRRKISLSSSRSNSKAKDFISIQKNQKIQTAHRLSNVQKSNPFELKLLTNKGQERKRTLAQNLATETSQDASIRQSRARELAVKFEPSKMRMNFKPIISRIQINKNSSICKPAQMKTVGKDSTSSNTPRDPRKEQLNGYDTVGGNVALDSQISEDLMKYF